MKRSLENLVSRVSKVLVLVAPELVLADPAQRALLVVEPLLKNKLLLQVVQRK